MKQRSTRRYTPVLLLIFVLAAACGGGSGAAPAVPEPPIEPPVDLVEVARQLLEDCGPGAVVSLHSAVLTLADVVADNGAAAGFVVDTGGINIDAGLIIPWTVDLVGDVLPEGEGMWRFEDAQGQPVNPFLPTDPVFMDLFTNGIGAMGPLLAALPDGTVWKSELNMTLGSSTVTGQVSMPFTGGAPSSTSGNLTVNEGDCVSELGWTGEPLPDFTGSTYPSVTFTALLTKIGTTDILTGSIVTDGTQTATASMSLNGGVPNDFVINLLTGAVTLAP